MNGKTKAHGYVYKQTEWANSLCFARCETAEELARMTNELGYTEATAAEIKRLVSWMNAENNAWGSGRAFGHVDIVAVCNPYDDEHSKYAAKQILAEHDYYASFA